MKKRLLGMQSLGWLWSSKMCTLVLKNRFHLYKVSIWKLIEKKTATFRYSIFIVERTSQCAEKLLQNSFNERANQITSQVFAITLSWKNFVLSRFFSVAQFAEIMGGYMAGSLAIMSDAAHLLSDCISFIVALLAIIWAKKSPDNYMTFGYRRIGKYRI